MTHMQGWTVVVCLNQGVSAADSMARRIVERACRERGGRVVSQSGGDLLISVPNRESAEAVALEVRNLDGVVDAYPKPPVGLP